MSKLTFLAVIAIVVGVWGGVIEVQWHPERLGALPGNVLKVAQNGSLLERGRGYVTALKRTGEFWLIRDEHQRLEVATRYVKSDAERLGKLLEKEDKPAAIVPPAEQLAASIDRAKSIAGASSVDTLLALQTETKDALTQAAGTLEKLKAAHEDYKDIEQQFAAVLGRLAGQLESLRGNKGSDVAGAKDEPPPVDGATPSPTIPAIQLNF